MACRIDDVVVAFEDPVREEVGAQILPDLLDRVELRRARRQQDRRDIAWPDEIAGGVPPGAIQQQDGVGVLGDMKGDLIDVHLHRRGVGDGQRERRADASGRADRAEQIGALVALIGRLARPRAALGPLADDAVLLADAGFILEPDLDRLALGYPREMGRKRAGEVFLKAWRVSPSCIGCRGLALIWEKPSCFKSLPTVRS